MSVKLQKGQKVSLTKTGSAGLSKIVVGLGWDEVEQENKGFFSFGGCRLLRQSEAQERFRKAYG